MYGLLAMKKRWKREIALWIARHRRTRLGKFAGSAAESMVRAYENDDGNSATNGEFRMLEALRAAEIRTAFDIGAHHGDWAEAALQALPRAVVHAFEVEPSARSHLMARVGSHDRVVVLPFGLSDRGGEVPVYVDARFPATTSLVEWDVENRTALTCRVESGDDYLAERGLERVDVVKIDVEGADLRVLRGFALALAEERVGMVQFEFSLWNAITRTMLRDFYELLEPHGFVIGKVFPNYIEWREYRPEHELYFRANFVAVHRSRTDISSTLGYGSSRDERSLES